MFYSHGFATPDATARKKIHGGSGTKGDGYSPGSKPHHFVSLLKLTHLSVS
jgi:hypothetical protein